METIRGYVDGIIFRNEENGYTVLTLVVKGKEITCVGSFPYIGEGELLEAEGSFAAFERTSLSERSESLSFSGEVSRSSPCGAAGSLSSWHLLLSSVRKKKCGRDASRAFSMTGGYL